MTESSYVFGIDLGTTYSAIAYVDEYGLPRVQMNKENTAVTPSVVFFDSPSNILVGQPARESGRVEPDKMVELVKRNMGDKNYVRYINNQEYDPEQISAEILKKLANDTEALLGQKVSKVVITVPAYFNEGQRVATHKAGEKAGFTVLGIIPEPTAAAIAYAATDHGDRTILVYDLGGGTFDVTLMKVAANSVSVLSVTGDATLGGRNWDDRLVAYLAEQWQQQSGLPDDLLADSESAGELYRQAEETKRLLSNRTEMTVTVSYNGKRARVPVTREKFNTLTADNLERTIILTRQVMQEARGMGVTGIDLILLVGGSCYMPQVQERLAQEFAGIEQKLFEPEQAVAKGAAIYANNREVQLAYAKALEVYNTQTGKTVAKLEDLTPTEQAIITQEVHRSLPGRNTQQIQQAQAMTIRNACSKNFGVLVYVQQQQQVFYMIPRNTPVPADREEEFYTDEAGQTEAVIEIYEAEGTNPPTDPNHPGCTKIKSFVLDLPPGLPPGHRIRVKYNLSEDGGQLRAHAWDPSSGKSVECQVDAFDTLMN